MSLEDRVRKIMQDALLGAAPVIETTTGERDPDALLTTAEGYLVLASRIEGIERAVTEIAREVDQLRGVCSVLDELHRDTPSDHVQVHRH